MPGSGATSGPPLPSCAVHLGPGDVPHPRPRGRGENREVKGVLTQGNSGVPATAENVAAAMSGGQFFWLDLDAEQGEDDVTAVLTDTFHFHPLAVEDAEHFGQRPKLDDYDDYVYMVAHGAAAGGTAPWRCTSSSRDHYAVTIHRGTCVRSTA